MQVLQDEKDEREARRLRDEATRRKEEAAKVPSLAHPDTPTYTHTYS